MLCISKIIDIRILRFAINYSRTINYSFEFLLQNVQVYPAQIPLKRDKEREMEIDSISRCAAMNYNGGRQVAGSVAR